ncbi:MAG TPA: transposase [bacterium]|nr:transposase [bacterium]
MGRAAPHAQAAEGAPLLDALLRRSPPARRGGKRGTFAALQDAIAALARGAGLLAARGAIALVDATAFEPRAASWGYRLATRRRAPRAARYPPHPKLTLAVDRASHLIVGAHPGVGPGPDAPAFAPVLRQAARVLARLGAVVADAGFDSEANHRLGHETLGIRRVVIRLNPRRRRRRWPATPYRRALRQAFPWGLYHARPQVESVISRLKRRLGSALSARHPAPQAAEQLLRVLSYNLLLLLPRPVHLSTEPL